eukprot:PhM_4_TR5925/c0_g1_i1/m.11454
MGHCCRRRRCCRGSSPRWGLHDVPAEDPEPDLECDHVRAVDDKVRLWVEQVLEGDHVGEAPVGVVLVPVERRRALAVDVGLVAAIKDGHKEDTSHGVHLAQVNGEVAVVLHAEEGPLEAAILKLGCRQTVRAVLHETHAHQPPHCDAEVPLARRRQELHHDARDGHAGLRALGHVDTALLLGEHLHDDVEDVVARRLDVACVVRDGCDLLGDLFEDTGLDVAQYLLETENKNTLYNVVRVKGRRQAHGAQHARQRRRGNRVDSLYETVAQHLHERRSSRVEHVQHVALLHKGREALGTTTHHTLHQCVLHLLAGEVAE